jgi:ferrous-iron efflux pump FieF
MENGEVVSVSMRAAPMSQIAGLMRAASLASVLAALVMIALKFAAYLETGSVSLLSTLFDSALDAGASLVNMIAIRHALTPADAEHRFGHGKAEPLAGLMQVAFILGSSLLLLIEVADHLMSPRPIEAPGVGIAVMIVSMAITTALIVFQRHVVKKTGSIAIKSDAAHYGSDVLVNASVIAALIASWQFGWWWIDPAVGLGISFVIAYTAFHIGREALDMLMDREMDEVERAKIKEIVRQHADVRDLHDLRTRIAGQHRFIQFHLELDGAMSLRQAHVVSDAVEASVLGAFPGAEVIVHQDPEGVVERRAHFQ